MNEMANEMSLKLARETYINEMRKDYWGNAMSIAFNLKKRKSNARKTAFYAFNSVKKIPGNAHSKDYFNKLDNELQVIFLDLMLIDFSIFRSSTIKLLTTKNCFCQWQYKVHLLLVLESD
jgi:hypothetical protein